MTADTSGSWIFWVVLGALVATRAWRVWDETLPSVVADVPTAV